MNFLPAARRDELMRALAASDDVAAVARRLDIGINVCYAWDSRRLRNRCICGEPIHVGDCRATLKATVALSEEIRSARIADGTSAVEAARFGVSVSTVYKATRGVHQRVAWRSAEDDVLRTLYPLRPWSEVLDALPGRTKLAIERRACDLDVKRRVWEMAILEIADGLSPEVAELRRRRHAAGLTLNKVATASGVPRGSLGSYEAGYSNPSRKKLNEWRIGLDSLTGVVTTPPSGVELSIPSPRSILKSVVNRPIASSAPLSRTTVSFTSIFAGRSARPPDPNRPRGRVVEIEELAGRHPTSLTGSSMDF